MNFRNTCCAALVCLLMVGCVAGPEQRAFDKSVNTALRTIEVLPMRHSEFSLYIFNNPGYSFGLIGVTIAEVNRASKARWLRREIAKANFDHVDVFYSALETAMEQAGYELVVDEPRMEANDATTKRADYGMHQSYRSSSSDAQLDLGFGFLGYAAAGSGDSAPYRPTVVLTARLLDSSGKRVLFADQIIYNAVIPGLEHVITLNPDERYRYPDFDDLEAAGPESIEGLRVAIVAVAQELARQLQR